MSIIDGVVDRLDDHGQRYDHIDPSKIRLLHDRVLIRELGTPSMIGMIHVPDIANKGGVDEFGYLRIGLVIATGPGDRFVELGVREPDALGYVEVRRKEITAPCAACGGMGAVTYDFRKLELLPFPIEKANPEDGIAKPCPMCEGARRAAIIMTPQCKPGEKVLYSRRREAEFNISGQRLSMVHAEQSVYAVLED